MLDISHAAVDRLAGRQRIGIEIGLGRRYRIVHVDRRIVRTTRTGRRRRARLIVRAEDQRLFAPEGRKAPYPVEIERARLHRAVAAIGDMAGDAVGWRDRLVADIAVHVDAIDVAQQPRRTQCPAVADAVGQFDEARPAFRAEAVPVRAEIGRPRHVEQPPFAAIRAADDAGQARLDRGLEQVVIAADGQRRVVADPGVGDTERREAVTVRHVEELILILDHRAQTNARHRIERRRDIDLPRKFRKLP